MSSFEQLIANSNVADLNTGDVLLVESKFDWIDRVIKFFGRSQFTHTAMLVDIKGSWFVVEARPKHQQQDYQMMPADWWLERNNNKDTYIGKMPTIETGPHKTHRDIEDKIKSTLLNPKWSVRPYKLTWCAMVVFLQKCLGIKRPTIKHYRDEREHPMICSTIVQEAWESAGVIEIGNFKSPGDIAQLSGGIDSLIKLKIDTQEGKRNSNVTQNNYQIPNLSIFN